ncbi:hypothetical protein [Methylovulum psychrotolerans]|uniref:Uncharacterized protein n=1 Tax=Methylovulum psychrotolerans TaxID=1704499 RepID=A0A2S5CKB2_9GAMM|nr:hypothetical protein [Methylovulum psychrotolerans]MBT9097041.1 hypothetical protein [Methylovulum psychrotolerans]POZ51226.1 hypothetical protein AADEFJLK_03190 [Methylovulum psychrotolerans]
MITKIKPQPETPSKINVDCLGNKENQASVLCFATIQKNKKLSDAKKRVYQASANLNW